MAATMALLAGLVCGALQAAQATRVVQPSSALTTDMRPIRKVITLLEEMKAQVEKDAVADETTYDKYMCWCKTNREEKTAAVANAEARIGELEALLEESAATAGKLRTEIETLEEEITADTEARDTAAALRAKELEAFQGEEADMKETRSLLSQAITILSKVQLMQKNGQSTHEESQQVATALVQVRNIVRSRFPKFHDTMQKDLFEVLGSLHDAGLDIERKGSASFQQAALLPWEKTEEQIGMEDKPNELEGAAAGAKSYNSRSGKILGVLEQMKDDFTADLFTAQKTDMEAEVSFQNLKAAKNGEIFSGQQQAARKEADLAATLDQAAKAKEEKENLEAAMAADQTFLATLEKNCATEDTEYKARLKIRTEEIRALGEAISILTEDAARDLYSKTVSFAQLGSAVKTHTRDRAVQRAVKRIEEAARKGKNWALASLAVRVRLDAFTKVKIVMDKMLAELKKQQKEEYAKWESCKKEIDTTEDSIKEATNLKEDLGEKHQALTDEISTLTNEIAELKQSIAGDEISLKEAGEERKAQNEVFQTQIGDQRATTNILKKASDRLRQFYGFIQAESQAQEGVANARDEQEPGAAAPPPPASGKAYEKSALSGGVLQLLDKIIKDAEVAEQELAAAEQKSQEDYGAYVREATSSIETDRETVRRLEQRVAEAEGEKSETEAAQLSNEEDLSKLNDLLNAHHLECDYLLKYFDTSVKGRPVVVVMTMHAACRGQHCDALLALLRLSPFEVALRELGVEVVGDLAYLQDTDLDKLGLPMIPRRKLLEAAGGEWRAALGSARPAKPKEASLDTATPKESVPGLGTLGPLPALGSELEQLVDGVQRFVDDFCQVNNLGPPSRAELLSLDAKTALRAMGLLGRGNAFAMQGVRRPGAAARSRARAAKEEEEEGVKEGQPFEDWPRLLEGFGYANGLPLGGAHWEVVRGLEREQAIRVMGFTSGLGFLMSMQDGGSPEARLEARLRATLHDGVPELPPLPPEAASAEGVRLLGRASAPGPPICSRSRSRRRSQRRRSCSSRSRVSLKRRRPPTQGWSDRMRKSSSSRGQRRHSSEVEVEGGDRDFAPLWRRNLDDFVQVNELDERSARALNEMPKLQALQIMGLVGRQNSFVIRGARNASAAVMHRVQRVQEAARSQGFEAPAQEECFAQLHRLVEDFISVNNLDERGIEAMRTLRPDVALQVMGFTAENAFLIRGVKNPSAALIARIAAAQRRPARR